MRGGDKASRAARRSGRRSDHCIRVQHVFLSRFKWRGAADTRGAGAQGQGQQWAARLRQRADEESRRRSRKRRPLLFPLSCSLPTPSSFPQRRRAAAGRIPSAHGGRGGGAGGGGRVRWGGGEVRTRRTGPAGHQRKVGHEHEQQETAIGISHGCSWPSHGRLEPSAAAGPDSCVGSRRPRWSPSSSAPVLRRAAPSPHPFPAPLRVASCGDEDSASTHVGGGGAGRAHGGGGDPRLSPPPALDSAGATAHRRRGCTPEHVRGAGGPAAIGLHVCALRRGGRLQSRRRRRRWRRPLAASVWLPSPGRTSLPTRAVEAHGALSLCHPAAASPPTPPFGWRRVRRRGRPPAQATPSLPIRHPRADHRNHTQTHTHSSTKHMYDTFKHISACKGMRS